MTAWFPPWGIVLLWRNREIGVGRKLLGTAGALLYSILYATVIVLALMQFAGLEIEWRGGFPPVLTFFKTKPNYSAVEAHRARQANPALPAKPAPPASVPFWTDFRGPKRDGHYVEKPISTHWPDRGLRTLWRQPVGGGDASFVIADRRANKFNSSVFWDGFVYGLDEGLLVCLDPATGQRRWKEGRYGYGQLLLANGYLVILSGDGELILVRATPYGHDELARFQAIHGKTWNHPRWRTKRSLCATRLRWRVSKLDSPDACPNLLAGRSP